MNLEDIKLSERRQPQKDNYCMIPLIWGTLEWSKSQRQKVEVWLPGAGNGGWELLFNGYRVSVWDDEKSSADGWWWCLHDNMNTLKATELYILKWLI